MTVHPALTNLIAALEEAYPDKATALAELSELDRERYLAKLEMINYIKLLTKEKK